MLWTLLRTHQLERPHYMVKPEEDVEARAARKIG